MHQKKNQKYKNKLDNLKKRNNELDNKIINLKLIIDYLFDYADIPGYMRNDDEIEDEFVR